MLKRVTAMTACLVWASVTVSAGATAADNDGNLARGRTGQGRSIRMKVFPDRVQLQSFSIELHCAGGYVLVDQESNFLPSTVSRNGHIHDAQVGTTDEILLRGHMSAHEVSGRIRVRDRLGKYRCSSPWVRFKTHA
jgi:hypothetical protein